MKCSFENCKEKATTGYGIGTNDKGSIPLCVGCLNSIILHDHARKQLMIDDLQIKISRVLKAEVRSR